MLTNFERGEVICEILRNSDLKPFSYSGRGMYGKRCIGVSISNSSPLPFLIQLCSDINNAEYEVEEIIDRNKIKHDSLGYDLVVYFTDLDWDDRYDGDDSEDDYSDE